MTIKKKGSGLRGIVAGATAICTCGMEGFGLNYRGYSILELAEKSNFEETAYLLLYGELPTKLQLDEYRSKLKKLRGIPPKVKSVLESIPADAHPMDVMRTACSVLGTTEPEKDFSQQQEITDRLLSVFPSIISYWYHFSTSQKRIETETDDETIAGHILNLINEKPPTELQRKAMDVSLILYAEHEFAASTFVARVTAATLTDLYSSVTAAIGTLRGPLHGGANEAAMKFISRYRTAEEAISGIKESIERKEKIMGFGHPVYTKADPRNVVIRSWSEKLSKEAKDGYLFDVSRAIEKFMWDEKELFPNLDFFSASTYHFLGIPTYLFTPIFVCSRLTGWAANIMEQRADNRLIRPSAEYIGPEERPYIRIEERG